MKIGETFVEAAYRTTADGLEVFGSSTRNAEGNYIAWHENFAKGILGVSIVRSHNRDTHKGG